MDEFKTLHYSKWDQLAGLCLANLLGFFCFYLPVVLYVESALPLSQKFPDFAIMGSLISFVVGYLARPLGAVFFGLIGDGQSLRRSYYISSLLLGLSTLGLGILPSVTILGWSAILLNSLLRLAQGFAIGGAYCVTSLMAYDLAPEGSKSRFTAFLQISSPAGYLTAIAVVILLKLLVGAEAFALWGWKTCFFFSLFLLFYSRKFGSKESNTNRHHDVKIRTVFQELMAWFKRNPHQTKKILYYVLPIAGATGLAVYGTNIYLLYFLQNVLKIEPTMAKFIIAISSLIFLPTAAIWGYVADRYGYKKILMSGLVMSLILLLPGYMAMEKLSLLLKHQSSSMGLLTVGIIAISTFLGVVALVAYCPLITFLCKNLPEQNRTTLFAVCYNFGFGILGSLAHTVGSYGVEKNYTKYGGIFLVMIGVLTALIIARIYAINNKAQLS